MSFDGKDGSLPRASYSALTRLRQMASLPYSKNNFVCSLFYHVFSGGTFGVSANCSANILSPDNKVLRTFSDTGILIDGFITPRGTTVLIYEMRGNVRARSFPSGPTVERICNGNGTLTKK